MTKNIANDRIWKCNSKVFNYCKDRRSNITSNGLLKIKCKKACELFELCQ